MILMCKYCSKNADFFRQHSCGWSAGICSSCAKSHFGDLKDLKHDCLPIPVEAVVKMSEEHPDLLEAILSRLGAIERKLGL